MKKLLIIFVLSLLTWKLEAQEVKDVKGNVIAYIARSVISDKNRNVICTFRDGGRIVDAQANTIGFLDESTGRFRLLDKDRVLVASMLIDGTVLDANEQRIGSIMRTTGPVIKNGNVIATLDTVEPMWAVCYFFLLNR